MKLFSNYKLTPLLPTTATVYGQFSGLKFDGASSAPVFTIKKSIESGIVIYGIQSNFISDYNRTLYTPKPKKTKAKAPKATRPRKTQGNGSTLNSQITFILPAETAIYTVRVFQTGTYEIPGILRADFRSADVAIHALADFLGYCLNTMVWVASFGIAMHDFKQILLPEMCLETLTGMDRFAHYERWSEFHVGNYVLRLDVMNELLSTTDDKKETSAVWHGPNGSQPRPIFDFDKTRMSVIFPIDDKRNVRVNVFTSGKMNYLGCPTVEAAERVNKFLSAFIAEHETELVTPVIAPDGVLPDDNDDDE